MCACVRACVCVHDCVCVCVCVYWVGVHVTCFVIACVHAKFHICELCEYRFPQMKFLDDVLILMFLCVSTYSECLPIHCNSWTKIQNIDKFTIIFVIVNYTSFGKLLWKTN